MFTCKSKIYIHAIQFAKYILIICIWTSAAKLSVFCQVWFFLKVALFNTNSFQSVVFFIELHTIKLFIYKK